MNYRSNNRMNIGQITTTIMVSPKFQVVIPKAVRETVQLKTGMKCQVLSYDDRIELIPIRSLQSLRGSLRGMDLHIVREPDRL